MSFYGAFGGAISYVEVPNMTNNIPAVLAIMRFIYDNIKIAEDDGEIVVVMKST